MWDRRFQVRMNVAWCSREPHIAIVISQVNQKNGSHLSWNVYGGMATSKPAGDFAVDVCLQT